MLFVDIGWRGEVTANTWTPVRISVQGGIEPFQGVVVIEYAQDATQTANITVPVAATPGRVSVTQAAVALPIGADRITFRLMDERGRLIQTLTASQFPRPEDVRLPIVGIEASPPAIAVSRSGGPAASISVVDENSGLGRSLRSAAPMRTIRPADLPMVWPAYEGLVLLTVDADVAPQVDARAMAAIRDWVSSGGHLAIVVTRPGSEWRMWLPASPLGDPIVVEEITRTSLPADLAAVVRAAAALQRREPLQAVLQVPAGPTEFLAPGMYGPPRPLNTGGIRRGAPSNAPDEDDDQSEDAAATDETRRRSAESGAETPPPPLPVPAESIFARAIRLTPAGEAMGWRVRWLGASVPAGHATVTPPELGAIAGSTGLMAEGPFGFGRITVLGIDPRQAAAVSSDAAVTAVWEDAARGLVESMQNLRLSQTPTNAPWPYYGQTSEQHARMTLLNRLADQIADEPPTLLFILLTMGVLVLLLGPVDAWVLGRLRLRHRSWLTALAWIGLAALVSFLAPRLSRSSSTELARFSALDILVPPSIPVPPGAGPAPEIPPLAWQVSLTGVFTGDAQAAHITPSPAAPAWWRGVSATDLNAWQSRLAATAPSVQVLPDLAGLQGDPWGGLPPPRPGAGSPRATVLPGSNTLLPTPLRTWTFRAFEDASRIAPPFTATVVRDDSGGGLTLEVRGLPADARIRLAHVASRNRWHELRFEAAPGGGPDAPPVLRATVPAHPGTARPAEWAPWTPDYRHWPDVGLNNGDVLAAPSMLSRLPAVGRRDAAFETFAAGDRWLALHMVIENAPADVAINGRPAGGRWIIARVLIPAPPTPEPPAPEPPQETTR